MDTQQGATKADGQRNSGQDSLGEKDRIAQALLMGVVFTPPLLLSASVGLLAFLLLVYAHSRYQTRTWTAADENIKVKFPSETAAK